MRPWRCRTSKTGGEDNGDRHTLTGTVATKTESPGGTTCLVMECRGGGQHPLRQLGYANHFRRH